MLKKPDANEEILSSLRKKICELEPGTPEYKAVMDELLRFDKQQAEKKGRVGETVAKYVVGLAGPLSALVIYGTSILIENSENWTTPRTAQDVQRKTHF